MLVFPFPLFPFSMHIPLFLFHPYFNYFSHIIFCFFYAYSYVHFPYMSSLFPFPVPFLVFYSLSMHIPLFLSKPRLLFPFHFNFIPLPLFPFHAYFSVPPPNIFLCSLSVRFAIFVLRNKVRQTDRQKQKQRRKVRHTETERFGDRNNSSFGH